MDPRLIAVLVAFGQGGVWVRSRPRVGILSMGEEMVLSEATPSPGPVRDANGPLLAALAARHGAQVIAVETVGEAGA